MEIPNLAKIKYTQNDKLKILNDVISIERNFGDVQNVYDICGLLGYCEICKKKNIENGCGKYYFAYKITHESITIATTTSGEFIIPDDYEVISY